MKQIKESTQPKGRLIEKSFEGLKTEVTASKLLFGPFDDYKKGWNNAMDKAIRFINLYKDGQGLFQLPAAPQTASPEDGWMICPKCNVEWQPQPTASPVSEDEGKNVEEYICSKLKEIRGKDQNLVFHSISSLRTFIEEYVSQSPPVSTQVEGSSKKEFIDLAIAIRCLEVELPETVWKDVNDRWMAYVKTTSATPQPPVSEDEDALGKRSISFGSWYSGMDKEKVERAYKMFLKESGIK